MASLRDIRRRIDSVTSTQKITKAMKMVAASKLRRAQEAIQRTRPYAYRMRDLVRQLASRAETDAHPLLRSGGKGKVGIIVVTGDRGLCGGFNSSIANLALRSLTGQFAGREVELTIVGRKGLELLKRRDCTIGKTYINIADKGLRRTAAEVIDAQVESFLAGEVDEVYCMYNEFKSAISQSATVETLLPLTLPGEDNVEQPATAVDYLYEPSPERVFESILVRHLQIQMHRVLCESTASEQGARMTAMDSATNNAGDMIDRLTLVYNRARQTAITTQLIEVVSGAEAL